MPRTAKSLKFDAMYRKKFKKTTPTTSIPNHPQMSIMVTNTCYLVLQNWF